MSNARLEHILSGRHDLLIHTQRANAKVVKDKHVTKRVLARIAADPVVRMRDRLRRRVAAAFRVQRASKATAGLIGCTMQQLRQHLEAQFTEGMTWDNYGKWHVDHIRPCASFDLLDPEQQRQCFHYSNLQPLWAIDNHRKGSKH